MSDQKIENLLNLAAGSTNSEKEKSENLGVGFDPQTDTWEIIVKYTGDILALESRYPGIRIVPLLGQYAIVTIRQNQLEDFSKEETITYIEKSKQLVFAVSLGRSVSCINSVQAPPLQLTGEGVLTALIDSGIDYTHRDFRNSDGTTRIHALWDQTVQGMPPEGYDRGVLYTMEDINRALSAETTEERKKIVPGEDRNGHGTAVAGIMAGNGSSSGKINRGTAPGSELLVVKMGTANLKGFPRTTELMLGLDFVIREAVRVGKPVAVNISFGNSYGAHDGESLLESYINAVSQMWKCSIVIAAGNDAASAGHFSSVMTSGQNLNVDISVSEYEPTLNIQIWKYYGDEAAIEIISPSGESSGAIKKILGTQRFRLGDTEILLYYGEPTPYSSDQEIYIDLVPREQYITEGIWTIRLLPGKITRGNIQMWLPTSGILNRNTGFLRPDPDLTITVPGTAEKAVTVGAYNAWLDDYADFSGRGYIGAFGRVKPELAAPGVNITTTAAGGGYTVVSGTSFAAPFVTGSAALLMEYGIVRKNDPYLYGDKLKAYLLAGARSLRGISVYPDIRVGYGALCTAKSLPHM